LSHGKTKVEDRNSKFRKSPACRALKQISSIEISELNDSMAKMIQ